jgi:hypothetical protein
MANSEEPHGGQRKPGGDRRVLGRRFRNVFLSYLRKAFEEGKLRFHGEMAGLAKPAAFDAMISSGWFEELVDEPIFRHTRKRGYGYPQRS